MSRSDWFALFYYLINVFPDVVLNLDRRLTLAWEFMEFDPGLLDPVENLPKIEFGNWVGGDRDGHPLVTPEITGDTLSTLRLSALVVVRRWLKELHKNLSYFCYLDQTAAAFQKRFREMEQALTQAGEKPETEDENQAFRMYVGMLMQKLPLDVQRDHAVQLLETPVSYNSPKPLIADLKLLQDALDSFGSSAIAYSDVKDVIRIRRLRRTCCFSCASLSMPLPALCGPPADSRFRLFLSLVFYCAKGHIGDEDFFWGAQIGEWKDRDMISFMKHDICPRYAILSVKTKTSGTEQAVPGVFSAFWVSAPSFPSQQARLP